MPTLRKDRGNAWLARVIINGQILDTKFFPPGRKKGRNGWPRGNGKWKGKKLLQTTEKEEDAFRPTRHSWPGVSNIWHLQSRTMSHSTFIEKQTVMQEAFSHFAAIWIFAHCKTYKTGFYQFLAQIADERGSRRANVYRKNLLSAWNWGDRGALSAFRSRLARLKELPHFRLTPWIVTFLQKRM